MAPNVDLEAVLALMPNLHLAYFARVGPVLVHRYLERVLPPDGILPRRVMITQAGEMVRRPGGRRLPFTAVEEFAVEEVAFSWRARFPVLPLVSMRVLDGYVAGEGRLEARLFGVPFMRVGGPETAEGEAIRYLSELPWVPHAIVANRALEWADIDERTVEVADEGWIGASGVSVRVRLVRRRRRRFRRTTTHRGQEDRAEAMGRHLR